LGGFPVICIDARHAKAALSLKVNKTDANDRRPIKLKLSPSWNFPAREGYAINQRLSHHPRLS
jgi:transposase